ETLDTLDLCLGCKACKSECPSSVDMAKIKAEYLVHYYKRNGLPLFNRLMGMLPTLNGLLFRVAPQLAPLANWGLQTPLAKALFARLGVHPARDLPGYARVWQMYGGRETLASYGVNNPDYETWQHAIPEQHWQFFREGMVDAVEENDFVLVHGGYDPHLPWEKQPWNELRWLKWNNPEPHVSGKVVVCGHTHQVNCLPLSVGHAICIDTWVYGSDGWLTALELESRSYVQANQQGMVRARRDLRVS
ncbi:MAG TPA: hypothetical protein PKA06_16340, partial [Gemmatales bacterium]|nr:hypothetical protein [Gemmatales bacterium]